MRKPASVFRPQRADQVLARRWAQNITKHNAAGVLRGLTPALLTLAFATAAHAQSIDFGPVKTVGVSIITILEFVGGAMAVGGLIFAGFEWFGRHNPSEAMKGVVGAIIGGVIIGAAVAWGSSTTGQTVQ